MAINIRGSDSLMWSTGIDTGGLSRDSAKAKGILLGLTQSISKMDVFAAIGIGSALAFKKAAREVYNFSRDFEHSMLEVSTISKMVSKDFEGISQNIMEMSRIFPENAIVLTKGLYQIVSAGYDSAKALDILTESTKLAMASVTDTFTAADAITSVMNAYGDAVSGAAEVSDKLFTIVRLGKTTMRELGPDITTVTGLAAQAGLEFDELSAIIAESVKTLKTPIAMTGIRGILNAIMSPTEESTKLMSDLKMITGEVGFEFNIATAKSMGFVNFLKKIMELTKGDISLLAQLFPNIRGLTGLLSVATDEGNKLSESLNEIDKSANAVNDAVNKMADSAPNKIKVMVNNIMADLKPFGDMLLDMVSRVTEEVNSFLSVLRSISDAEIKVRETGRDWYDDTYYYFEDLTNKALTYFGIIEKPGRFDYLRKLSPAELSAEVARLEAEVRKNFLPPSTDAGKPSQGKTPESYADDVNRRAALMREMLEITKSYEEKAAEIHKHYAELIMVTDNEVRKNRLRELEATEIRLLKESMKTAPLFLGGTPEDLEEYSIQVQLLREKQHEDQKAADERYRDWKISNSKELIQIEIARLDEVMGLYTEQENYEAGRIDDRERRVEQLADYETKENRAKINDIIKDTTVWNKKQLQEYADFLSEQAELYADNDAMKEEIIEKYDETMQKVYNSELEKLHEIEDALRGLGDFVGIFDQKLGNVISDISEVTSGMSQVMTATTGWGEAGGLIKIASSVDGWAKNLSKYLVKVQDTTRGKDAMSYYWDGWDEFTKAQKEFQISITYGEDKIRRMAELISYLQTSYDDNWKSMDPIERIKAMQDIENQINRMNEYITGTTTDSIADSITDGLMQGLDSAKVFADTFEDLIKYAMLSAFQAKIINEMMSPFYDSFAELSKGGLTEEEIKTLKSMFLGYERGGKLGGTYHVPGIGDFVQESFGAMSDLWESLGFTTGQDTKKSGMTGAISGITEDTAGLLAGQFNAMRVSTKVTADGVSNIVTYQKRIADNTDYLKSIDRRLMQIERNGNGYTRVFGN
jgi:TP901 family phage tail tape measure protein